MSCYTKHTLADSAHTMVLRTGKAPHGAPNVCRTVLDFLDVSERPIFNRFNFESYYISEITKDSALATQCIVANGKHPISVAGFVSSFKGAPRITDVVTFVSPQADGTICATITGLSPYTRYNTRAFDVANGIDVTLLEEGNVLIKALDGKTGAVCAACDAEGASQFGLWCIMASPLMLGTFTASDTSQAFAPHESVLLKVTPIA